MGLVFYRPIYSFIFFKEKTYFSFMKVVVLIKKKKKVIYLASICPRKYCASSHNEKCLCFLYPCIIEH